MAHRVTPASGAEVQRAAEEPSPALWVVPDPVTSPDVLSGCGFLYFSGTFRLVMPPLLLLPGCLDAVERVRARRPHWAPRLLSSVASLGELVQGWERMTKDLAPLKDRVLNVFLVYPAHRRALEEALASAEALGLPTADAADLVPYTNAAAELARHLFTEVYLAVDRDEEALYSYCDKLFAAGKDGELLTAAYLLRLPIVATAMGGGARSRVLLTNPRLAPLLSALPTQGAVQPHPEGARDVAAWEIFRQLLSPRIDPLDAAAAEFVATLLAERPAEIEALRARCMAGALELNAAQGVDALAHEVEDLVRTRMAHEIAELLALDRRAMRDFLAEVFGDKATWLALAAAVSGLLGGNPTFTVGGAVGAIATVGAAAVRAAADKRERVRSSEYALVYRASRFGAGRGA